MEYYAAIKNDEFMSFVGTWMNLETITLSKLTQEQKNKHRMFSLIDSLTLLPRLECSGAISADSHASVSLVAGITGTCHHTQLIFVFLVDTGLHHVGQAGLKLQTSGDPPSSAFQNAGIPDMSHHDWSIYGSQAVPQQAICKLKTLAHSKSKSLKWLRVQNPENVGATGANPGVPRPESLEF
ncbi:hypothetical protein AAY473_035733 [Plecturocebus cupreus]